MWKKQTPWLEFTPRSESGGLGSGELDKKMTHAAAALTVSLRTPPAPSDSIAVLQVLGSGERSAETSFPRSGLISAARTRELSFN